MRLSSIQRLTRLQALMMSIVLPAQSNGDQRLGDAELGEQVDQHRAVVVEQLALRHAGAHVLERDVMLVGHGQELAVDHVHDIFQARRAEGAHVLDLADLHRILVRDVRDEEGLGVAPADAADARGRAARLGRQHVELVVAVLDHDRRGRHALLGEDVELAEAAPLDRDQVDRLAQLHGGEGVLAEDVKNGIHRVAPKFRVEGVRSLGLWPPDRNSR